MWRLRVKTLVYVFMKSLNLYFGVHVNVLRDCVIRTSYCQSYLLPVVLLQLSEWCVCGIPVNKTCGRTPLRDWQQRQRREQKEWNADSQRELQTDRDTDAECAFHININQSGLCEWFGLCLCWHASTVYPPMGWMAHCFPQSPSACSLL